MRIMYAQRIGTDRPPPPPNHVTICGKDPAPPQPRSGRFTPVARPGLGPQLLTARMELQRLVRAGAIDHALFVGRNGCITGVTRFSGAFPHMAVEARLRGDLRMHRQGPCLEFLLDLLAYRGLIHQRCLLLAVDGLPLNVAARLLVGLPLSRPPAPAGPGCRGCSHCGPPRAAGTAGVPLRYTSPW
jgi:hypothetical protein